MVENRFRFFTWVRPDVIEMKSFTDQCDTYKRPIDNLAQDAESVTRLCSFLCTKVRKTYP